METLRYFAVPINKVEKNDDGSINVYGPVTTDDIDSDGQIIDADFASKGLSEWLRTGGNIRVMHSTNLYPAGVGMELNDEGSVKYLRGHVVEPTAIRLVEEKVLQAYSVGISDAKIRRDQKGIEHIVGGDFVEVSLVDRPANSACKFEMVKAAKGGAPSDSLILKAEGSDDKVDCALCKGTGKIKGGSTTCPDCKGEGMVAKGDAKDEAEGEASAPAETDSGDAKEPQEGKDKNTSKPKASKATREPAGIDQSYEATMVRLHDAVCPAVSPKKLKAWYPDFKKAHSLLEAEVISKALKQATDDLRDLGRISRLAKTLDFVKATASMDGDEFEAKREGLRKAYKDEYPKPKVKRTTGQATAFNRPFITSGRADMKPGQAPRFPTTHSINAEQFDREALTAGQERASASKKRSFYTNAAKDQAMWLMQAMHDHIQAEFPEICGASMIDGYEPAQVEVSKFEKSVSKEIEKLHTQLDETKALTTKLSKQITKRDKVIEKLGALPDDKLQVWKGPGLPLNALRKSSESEGKLAEPVVDADTERMITLAKSKDSQEARAAIDVLSKSKKFTQDQIVELLTK